MGDFITVLTAKVPMTKRIRADGTVEPSANAKNFSARLEELNNIVEAHDLLERQRSRPYECAIRGLHNSGDTVVPETTRTLEQFKEVPHHWVFKDIDNYDTRDPEWIRDPLRAILSFVDSQLPEAFRNVSFHWKLSSSAGTPGKETLLRAHLVFWLAEPLTGDELERRFRALKTPIDPTLFRTVQVHYLADPIVEDGAVDPVPAGLRSGLHLGLLGDDVIWPAESVPEAPEATQHVRPGRDGMKDPTLKRGVIGAFNRVMLPVRVIDEGLVETMDWETDGETKRITWTAGGGSPGGVCVTDDALHFCNMHASSPVGDRAVNAFDFVRLYQFDGDDDAMYAFAMSLPDVAAEVERERQAFMDSEAEALGEYDGPTGEQTSLSVTAIVPSASDRERALQRAIDEINAAVTAAELEREVCPRIAGLDWTDGDRPRLIAALLTRYQQIAGTRLPIDTARAWIPAPVTAMTFPDMSRDGRILGTPRNIEKLCRDAGIVIRYNAMTKDTEIIVPGAEFSVDNAANASLAHVLGLCKARDMKLNTAELKQFICGIGDENIYSPPLTWIGSRPWDGKDRLQDWFDTVRGPAEKRSLKEILMRRWALQCIAILHNTGETMARGIITFQGRQYQGKTRWFKALAPEGMVGTGVHLNPNDKDCVKILIRHWIVEVGEFDGITRKYDIAGIKNFVSLVQDRLRLPYAAAESAYPRRTSIGGTVNDAKFLRDPTGNSRFWVVEAESIVADHGIDMQQFWAQVYALWKGGEHHWLTDTELAMLNESNEDHQVDDPIEEKLRMAFRWEDPDAERKWLTATQAAESAGLDHLSHGDAIRVGGILRRLNGNTARKSHGVTQLRVPETWISRPMPGLRQ